MGVRGNNSTSDNELVVLLDGVLAGFAARSRRGEIHFSYSEDYPPSAPPLSVSVDPAARGTHRIADWLDGLLPDSPEMRSRWARRLRATSTEPFDLLSTRAGSLLGAAVDTSRLREIAAGLPGALAAAAADCPDWALDTAHRTAGQITAWAGPRL